MKKAISFLLNLFTSYSLIIIAFFMLSGMFFVWKLQERTVNFFHPDQTFFVWIYIALLILSFFFMKWKRFTTMKWWAFLAICLVVAFGLSCVGFFVLNIRGNVDAKSFFDFASRIQKGGWGMLFEAFNSDNPWNNRAAFSWGSIFLLFGNNSATLIKITNFILTILIGLEIYYLTFLAVKKIFCARAATFVYFLMPWNYMLLPLSMTENFGIFFLLLYLILVTLLIKRIKEESRCAIWHYVILLLLSVLSGAVLFMADATRMLRVAIILSLCIFVFGTLCLQLSRNFSKQQILRSIMILAFLLVIPIFVSNAITASFRKPGYKPVSYCDYASSFVTRFTLGFQDWSRNYRTKQKNAIGEARFQQYNFNRIIWDIANNQECRSVTRYNENASRSYDLYFQWQRHGIPQDNTSRKFWNYTFYALSSVAKMFLFILSLAGICIMLHKLKFTNTLSIYMTFALCITLSGIAMIEMSSRYTHLFLPLFCIFAGVGLHKLLTTKHNFKISTKKLKYDIGVIFSALLIFFVVLPTIVAPIFTYVYNRYFNPFINLNNAERQYSKPKNSRGKYQSLHKASFIARHWGDVFATNANGIVIQNVQKNDYGIITFPIADKYKKTGRKYYISGHLAVPVHKNIEKKVDIELFLNDNSFFKQLLTMKNNSFRWRVSDKIYKTPTERNYYFFKTPVFELKPDSTLKLKLTAKDDLPVSMYGYLYDCELVPAEQ